MEQTTSWEDNVSSTSREKKMHFMEAQGLLSCQ